MIQKRLMKTKLVWALLSGCALALVAPGMQAEPADWNGFFIGGNVGANWQSYDFGDYRTQLDLTEQFFNFEESKGPRTPQEPIGGSEFLFFNTAGDYHHNHQGGDVGLTGGTQIGFNKQVGHFVLGLEGSFNALSHSSSDWTSSQGSGSSDFFFQGVSADTTTLSMRKAEAHWNSAVMGKLGFATGRFLFYGIGGVAFTDVTAFADDRATSDFFVVGQAPQPSQPGQFLGTFTSRNQSNDDRLLVGWTAGTGVEYALSQLFTVGLEYRHSGFGSQTFHFDSHGPITPGNTSVGTDSDQVTFKVNFYFSHLPR